tara:strand:- start:608 stop:796 length:189 start_codon:yes stop_codon:yes gene_type:complete
MAANANDQFEMAVDEAITEIDIACAKLADLGYVDEASMIRHVLDREFPADSTRDIGPEGDQR